MKTSILLAAVTCCVVTGIAVPASGIDIVLTFDDTLSEAPGFDPDGAILTDLMEAAALYWEDIMEDSHTLDVTFFYRDFTTTTLADTLVTSFSGGQPTACRIRVDSTPNYDWYLDPTPFDHSEYDLSQTTVGNLLSDDRSDWYNNYPPDLLEASYWGSQSGSAPPEVTDSVDMLTVLLHEFGHGVGMVSQTAGAEIGDGDYDFDPNQVWGQTVAAEYYSASRAYHLAGRRTLMYPFSDTEQRVMPSATDVLAIAGAVGWSDIDLPRKDFIDAGDSQWNTGLNWSGGQVPDNADDVKIRHGGDVDLVADGQAGVLEISEGNRVLTGDHRLSVYLSASIGPSGLTESLLSASGSLGECIILSDLNIGQSGIAAADGGLMSVSGTIANNGTIRATNGGMFEALAGLDSASNVFVGSAGDLRVSSGVGLTMQPVTMLTIEDNGSTVEVGSDMVQDGKLSIQNYGRLIVGGSIDAGLNDWSEGDLQDAGLEVAGQLRLGVNHNAHLKTARSDIVVGTLTAVGYGSTSTLGMRGGTLTTRYLHVGRNVGSDGVLIVSVDGIFHPWIGFTDSTEAFVVGYAGTGGVTQLGGTVTRDNSDVGYPELAVAGSEGGKGTYNLHEGKIRLSNFHLGQGGEGVFTQTGGDVIVHNELIFGQQVNGRGFYHLKDGTLSVNTISNGSGSGELNIDGGTLTLTGASAEVEYLNIGLSTGGNGELSLNGKILTVNTLQVAVEAVGKLSLDNCTTVIGSTLVVGSDDRGEMTQTGGSVTTPTLRVGSGATGRGQYAINGGTLTASSVVQVGGYGQGTIVQTSGASVLAGDVYLGAGAGSRGQWSVGDGHLWSSGEIVVGFADEGVMTLAGGVVDVPNDVLEVRTPGELSGYGLLLAEVDNSGTLRAGGGVLVVNGPYNGGGLVDVDPGAELVFRGPTVLGGGMVNDGVLTVEKNIARLDAGMTTAAADARVEVQGPAVLQVYSGLASANIFVAGNVEHTSGSAVLSEALDLDGRYLLDGTGQLTCAEARIDKKFAHEAGVFQPDAMYIGQLGGLASYTVRGGELHAGDVSVGVSYDDGEQPGVFAVLNPGAYVEISGELLVSPQGHIATAPGSVIHLTGSPFINQSHNPKALEDLTRATLIFEGGDLVVDPFEIAGRDLGQSPDGLVMNFAVGTLQIGGNQPGHLRLVDKFVNQLRWGQGEALYVHNLIISPGSSLDLDGQLLYYSSFTNLGGSVHENGGRLVLVPEPTTLALMTMCGAVLLKRRRN